MFKILVVEDDKDLNQTVCAYLNKNGYEAIGCLSANDAYNEMYGNLFDMIISDIMMPQIDGYEFAKTVREMNQDIPILFMTAREDFESKRKGFGAGVDDYMVKPIDLNELVLRIEVLLRRAKIATNRKLSIGSLVLDMEERSAHVGEEEIFLTVMQNYGTLLQSPELSEEQRIQYGKAIQEQTKRLSNLVMNILKLNKLENQQIYPNVEKYDLGEQLCECMLEFESVWEEKNMEIDVDIQEEVQIQADKELLSLVWNNLLSNALKFTEADGKVSLLLKGDEKLAYVQIKDTGCGMSAETGKNIFKKLGRFVFCVGDCSWNSWDGCHRDGVSGVCKNYKEAAGEAAPKALRMRSRVTSRRVLLIAISRVCPTQEKQSANMQRERVFRVLFPMTFL